MGVDLTATFKEKKVFLTGHTGFKGTWMLAFLKQLGAETKGYSLAPKLDNGRCFYDLANGDTLCNSVIADIRDGERLSKEIADFQPDFVFHFAAQALVLDSYAHPIATWDTNVMGTAKVMEALKTIKRPCTSVMITTDKVYENLETIRPYKEDDHLGGYDPYSASKAGSELVISSYRRSFFHPDKIEEHGQRIAAARSGNVIGGGDFSANRIIPDLVRALENNEPLQMRNPAAVRPWQHVLEPLHAYLTLGAELSQDLDIGGAYNFGPREEDEKTVESVVQTAIDTWGEGTYEKPELTNQPHEAGLLKLDISKAKDKLNWEPVLNSTEAIAWTIDWYKRSGGNELGFSEGQIGEYLGRWIAL